MSHKATSEGLPPQQSTHFAKIACKGDSFFLSMVDVYYFFGENGRYFSFQVKKRAP